MRLEEGGWARETTVRELPTSKELAGVNMRLGPGVYRELHWHNESEWAYIIAGTCRITVLDVEGGSYIDDLAEGDLWYFPTGYPHSIQGKTTCKISADCFLANDVLRDWRQGCRVLTHLRRWQLLGRQHLFTYGLPR